MEIIKKNTHLAPQLPVFGSRFPAEWHADRPRCIPVASFGLPTKLLQGVLKQFSGLAGDSCEATGPNHHTPWSQAILKTMEKYPTLDIHIPLWQLTWLWNLEMVWVIGTFHIYGPLVIKVILRSSGALETINHFKTSARKIFSHPDGCLKEWETIKPSTMFSLVLGTRSGLSKHSQKSSWFPKHSTRSPKRSATASKGSKNWWL